MKAVASRRESKIQRVLEMRGTLDRLEELDDSAVLSGVPDSMREVLAKPRFRTRMAVRRARSFVGFGLFSPAIDDGEVHLLVGGPDAIARLSLAIGTHVHWQDVIRLVGRADRDGLDMELGLDTRPIALRGRRRDVGVEVAPDDVRPLPDRIATQGALAWACWLARREPASARRLRVMTPSSISDLVPALLPSDAEMRERRRYVVDVEINALLGLSSIENESSCDG